MAEFVVCANGDDMPKHPHKAVRAPDDFKSVVCHWADKEDGTWGRGSVDEYCSGLQAWFPWGGDEYDSQNLDTFQVLVKHDHYRYSWIKASRVRDNPGKFHHLEVNGYSPAVISGRLGKILIDAGYGWTSWDGVEVCHEGSEVDDAVVLCVREKNCLDCPAHVNDCTHGCGLPDRALQSKDSEGSYVCFWNDKEEGTFGRIRADGDDFEAWFGWGGGEFSSRDIDAFQVVCEDPDYKYKWKKAHKIKKRPNKYEVFKIGAYSPAIVEGLLGKAEMGIDTAWTTWGGEERTHTGDEFENAKILCYKEREDD